MRIFIFLFLFLCVHHLFFLQQPRNISLIILLNVFIFIYLFSYIQPYLIIYFILFFTLVKVPNCALNLNSLAQLACSKYVIIKALYLLFPPFTRWFRLFLHLYLLYKIYAISSEAKYVKCFFL